MTALYEHPGYGMVDHQLDPLMDVCRSWIDDTYQPSLTPAQKRETAETLATLLEAAANQLRADYTPAAALDIECDVCFAAPGQMCWNPKTYADNKHPHKDRVAATRGRTVGELAWL